MKVYGVIGWKNAGKTSLMERLVAEITGRGFSVSTVKHVHHDVDLDQPGKDTFRHRAAGAAPRPGKSFSLFNLPQVEAKRVQIHVLRRRRQQHGHHDVFRQ